MTVPLVLLHPFPFDSRVFADLREELDAHPIRLLTPDMHGDWTTAPDLDQPPSLDYLADQVIALLDTERIDKAVVGGVSMGGYVVLNVLRRYPDRLLGVILADTKTAPDGPDALGNRQAMATKADHGERPDARGLLGGMLSPYTLEKRGDVVAALAGIIDGQVLGDVAWNQRAMAARPDTGAVLAAVSVPVLIVVGSDDRITTSATAKEMAASTSESSLVVLPETGHLAVAEDPAAVAAAITDWLTKALPALLAVPKGC